MQEGLQADDGQDVVPGAGQLSGGGRSVLERTREQCCGFPGLSGHHGAEGEVYAEQRKGQNLDQDGSYWRPSSCQSRRLPMLEMGCAALGKP